jgi:hypothetical protein
VRKNRTAAVPSHPQVQLAHTFMTHEEDEVFCLLCFLTLLIRVIRLLFVRRLYSSLQLSTELCCPRLFPAVYSFMSHDSCAVCGTNLSYIRSVRGLNKLTSSNYREALLLL